MFLRVSVVGLAAVTAAVLLGSARAENAPRIEVDASDNPLKIQGVIGEEPGLIGAIRLHGDGDVGAFRMLFSDLKREGGTEIVPRAHITVTGQASLGDDDYQDVQVKVDGLTVPGTYTGHLELLPHDQPRTQATQIDIAVTATARPALTAVAPNDRVRGNLAHCGYSCTVTAWLVPGTAGREKQTIRFTLRPHQQAKVNGVKIFGTGDNGGHELSEAELGLANVTGTLSKNGVLVIPLAISPNGLPADHYTGSLHFDIEGLDAPVTVPIDFSVRNEPFWALVALAVGILLGRLSNYLQGYGRDTLNAYRRARTLRARIQRRLEDGDASKAGLLATIDSARDAIDDNDLDEAKQLLDQVETALKEKNVAVPEGGLPKTGVRGVLETISPVEAGLGLGAHVLGVLVWVGLLVVGFQTLYVNQGASFGSNGIFDYVGLILWGLTADVASRSLGNLAGGSTVPHPA
jgi:hypothetical protein